MQYLWQVSRTVCINIFRGMLQIMSRLALIFHAVRKKDSCAGQIGHWTMNNTISDNDPFTYTFFFLNTVIHYIYILYLKILLLSVSWQHYFFHSQKSGPKIQSSVFHLYGLLALQTTYPSSYSWNTKG